MLLFDQVKVFPVSVEMIPSYLSSVVDQVKESSILIEFLGPGHLSVHLLKLLMYLFCHFCLIGVVVQFVPYVCTLLIQNR